MTLLVGAVTPASGWILLSRLVRLGHPCTPLLRLEGENVKAIEGLHHDGSTAAQNDQVIVPNANLVTISTANQDQDVRL